MRPKLFSDLHQLIEKFVKQNCEGEQWPPTIAHPELALHMAQAAQVVFDATSETSRYVQGEVQE